VFYNDDSLVRQWDPTPVICGPSPRAPFGKSANTFQSTDRRFVPVCVVGINRPMGSRNTAGQRDSLF